jgi:Zn-finger nucleic acid-binding protein
MSSDRRNRHRVHSRHPGAIRCPRCGKQPGTVSIENADNGSLYLSYLVCPDCRAIWLDDGDGREFFLLEELLEVAKAELQEDSSDVALRKFANRLLTIRNLLESASGSEEGFVWMMGH